MKKKKSVTNGLALLAEYGFVLIHYKQKQHLKRPKQNEKKVQVVHFSSFKVRMHCKQIC